MMKEINELRIKLNNQIEYQFEEELLLSDEDFASSVLSLEKELELLYKIK